MKLLAGKKKIRELDAILARKNAQCRKMQEQRQSLEQESQELQESQSLNESVASERSRTGSSLSKRSHQPKTFVTSVHSRANTRPSVPARCDPSAPAPCPSGTGRSSLSTPGKP